MAAKLVLPTDPIEVKTLFVCLFGQPGARKTSLAQTSAKDVFTLAFDAKGIARCYGRKTAMMFDTWNDVIEQGNKGAFDGRGAIVIDTVGMLIQVLSHSIADENSKWGTRMGGLSQQGYGVLMNRFSAWVNGLRAKGCDIIAIAHEKLDKDRDETYSRPDIVGSNYATVMYHADLVGYMSFYNGKRSLDFNPTDKWMAKAPPCGWPTLTLPDFGAEPLYLHGLLEQAKESMGKISQESAELQRVVEEWRHVIERYATPDHFNDGLKNVSPDMPKLLKAQVWQMFQDHAATQNYTWDAKRKAFVAKAEEAKAGAA